MNKILTLIASWALCCFAIGCSPPATDEVDVDTSTEVADPVVTDTSNNTTAMETPNSTTVSEVPAGETP